MDMHNTTKFSRGISPFSRTDDTAIVSEIIDFTGFEENEFVILTGSLADAGATFTTLFEHGNAANLSDAVAVPDEDLIGTEAQATFTQENDDSVFKLGYRGIKKYGRVTITPAGNAAAALIGAVWAQRGARKTPV